MTDEKTYFELENCACTGSNLPKYIQPVILAILAHGPRHGYSIVRRIGEEGILGGNEPDATGVYRVLKGMEKDGSVSYEWDMSDTGPAKKCYAITQRGRDCLFRWHMTLGAHQVLLYKMQNFIKAALEVEEKEEDSEK